MGRGIEIDFREESMFRMRTGTRTLQNKVRIFGKCCLRQSDEWINRYKDVCMAHGRPDEQKLAVRRLQKVENRDGC